MFNKKELVTKETVKDFIENRSDLMDEITKSTGCINLIKFIRQDPSNFNYINEVLLGHQWISTSEFLQDLSVKMQNHVQQFEELFDKCASGFLGQAIYAVYELERIANAIPSRITAIAEFIMNDEETLNRLTKTFETEDNVFKRIAEKYPELDIRNFSNLRKSV